MPVSHSTHKKHSPIAKSTPQSQKALSGHLLRGATFATELGFTLSIPIVGGVLLGRWVDARMGTHPIATIGLLILGIIISHIQLYLIVKKYMRIQSI